MDDNILWDFRRAPKKQTKNTVECHYFIVIKMYDNMGAQFSFNCLRNIALVQNVLIKRI